ncbi:MAG TPA: Mut7-C RNAse domain-containing protein, partial [Bacteroidota bacterium]|nr:Mut7-C RNAse domain-containing protein [Bacteroidota bacterium]
IARLGIPEENVDAALRNGESAAPDSVLASGDRLSLYPVFESFDISGITRMRHAPLRAPRFVLDVHLGKLAAFMRMMGLDAMYETGYADDELVSISVHEARALLSKDRRLLEHPTLTRAYFVKATDPKEQLVEVIARFQLSGAIRPFTRCLLCNRLLVSVSKADVRTEAGVPERVQEEFEEFFRCPSCQRLYWKGSHYKRMQLFIADTLAKADRAH